MKTWILMFLVSTGLFANAQAMEVTAQQTTAEIGHIKRLMNEKIIGLMAVTEALGTHMNQQITDLKLQISRMETCNAKLGFYKPDHQDADSDGCFVSPLFDCPNPGDVCQDGTVYAGDGSGQKMYTTPDDGGVLNWGGALSYCSNSTEFGYDDWVLPAYGIQIAQLVTFRNKIGNFNNPTLYITSTPEGRYSVYAASFVSGGFTNVPARNNHAGRAYPFRCVRLAPNT